jgi:hypothetical protein
VQPVSDRRDGDKHLPAIRPVVAVIAGVVLEGSPSTAPPPRLGCVL